MMTTSPAFLLFAEIADSLIKVQFHKAIISRFDTLVNRANTPKLKTHAPNY
jgi:hypothetical protein